MTLIQGGVSLSEIVSVAGAGEGPGGPAMVFRCEHDVQDQYGCGARLK